MTTIDHVQITIPPGEEDSARRFYCDLLGFPEVAKPESLAGRGGLWLQLGGVGLHIGVEENRPPTKAHVAYHVDNLAAVRAKLEAAGVTITGSIPIPGVARFECRDPFGNRVEIIQRQLSDRQRISSGAPWESIAGYSRAVQVGNVIHVAGTTATGPDGQVIEGGAYSQTKQALENIRQALEQAGAGMRHVVRTRMFVTDISQWEDVARAHGEVFGEVRPASTMVEVSALIDPAMLVEIEVDAVL